MTTPPTPEERAAAVEVLRRVEGRIAAGWSRYRMARDNRGIPCGTQSPRASQFCLLGAFDAEAYGAPVAPFLLAQNAVRAVIERPSFPHWNDARGRKKSEVVAAVRAARERLEADK